MPKKRKLSKPTILLVDYNNLLMRSIFANQRLHYGRVFTGGLYGFINIITSLVERYTINRIIVCKDKKPYYRSDFYPEYKTDRVSLPEDTVENINVARQQVERFLALLEVPICVEKGWEADDIIGAYCRIRCRNYSKMFIASNDSDLYQLLGVGRKNVFLCTHKGLYGLVNFKKDFDNIECYQWPRVVALRGSHNGVPGIPRVGNVTAIKLIKEGVTNNELIERYGEVADDIKLKIDLATFPLANIWPGPKLVKHSPIHFRSTKKVLGFFDGYGINMQPRFKQALERLSR